jgi:hypothetical protein
MPKHSPEHANAFMSSDIICSYLLPYLLDDEDDLLRAIGLFKIPYRKACCSIVNNLINNKVSFDEAAFFMKMLFNEDRNEERIRRCRERKDKIGQVFADYFHNHGQDGPYADQERFTSFDVPPELREKAIKEYLCNELNKGRLLIYREDAKYQEKIRELDVGFRHLRLRLSPKMWVYAKKLGLYHNPVMQYWSVPCNHPHLDIFIQEEDEHAALIIQQELIRRPAGRRKKQTFD